MEQQYRTTRLLRPQRIDAASGRDGGIGRHGGLKIPFQQWNPGSSPGPGTTVKTVRFTEVVIKAGAPDVYTLWAKPTTDRRLQSLIKNHRIMTIQASDSGTDFGMANFCERKGARYLAFPKSLKRFADDRVIGVKWELVKS